MEAPEGSGGPGEKRGPMTSTPKEHHPPPGLPDRTDSATSLDSDSSGEDWLIKVCCPKARHRYRRYAQAKKPTKTGFSHLDKEEDFIALAEWMPITPYQVYPGVPRQESTDLEWLIRLRCPRAQMEQMRAERKQSLPAVSTPLSRSPSKAGRSIQPGGTKDSENWLKHFSIAQAIVNERQDVVGSTQALLEKENCFVRGSAFLESYNTSSYDPFFLKCSTDTCKVSVPPLYDPLLKEIRERYLEAGIIQQCDTGKVFSSKEMNELHKAELPLLPLSRQLMNPIEWLKIPAGYIESESRQKSRKAHMRAREGKEQARTRKKNNILARSPERNLLPSLKHGLVLA
ncbi:uncharacterized protein LOC117044778 isoform X3 [Lacerta agilis]|uniref:uncharacterized protein LOC117044778 isoform X3 n=1 Tax=Lacerta agilis TaxID=80427 RepID=UPI001419CA97|nr:uncharacterized protein LOC117044778 isoform X3 [Lacerta agilis]